MICTARLSRFCAVLFVGSCYANVGGDPCTWGPSYWCKDDASAKECSASEYCRVNVWNTKVYMAYNVHMSMLAMGSVSTHNVVHQVG